MSDSSTFGSAEQESPEGETDFRTRMPSDVTWNDDGPLTHIAIDSAVFGKAIIEPNDDTILWKAAELLKRYVCEVICPIEERMENLEIDEDHFRLTEGYPPSSEQRPSRLDMYRDWHEDFMRKMEYFIVAIFLYGDERDEDLLRLAFFTPQAVIVLATAELQSIYSEDSFS